MERINSKPPDQRLRIRQIEALPLLDNLKFWLEMTRTTVPSRGDIASAIHYVLARWAVPVRSAWDGTISTDNNFIECAIRLVALGGKSELFAGTDADGERPAAIHSLISTAQLIGHDLEAYLRRLIGNIADTL